MSSSHTSKGADESQISKLQRSLNSDQPYKDPQKLDDPQLESEKDVKLLKKMRGCLVGLAVGDALGAPTEFRPYEYMLDHPVKGMQDGGTWNLQKGYWTDDTSMALCLAASLIVKEDCDIEDQLRRYLKWFRLGYMSSTGECFDIGAATRDALMTFEKHLDGKSRSQKSSKEAQNMSCTSSDFYFGATDAAGNGCLMRVAPLPMLFYHSKTKLIECIEPAMRVTHGDPRAIDACKFYAGLILGALSGVEKNALLAPNWYRDNIDKNSRFHPDVQKIIEGSYKNKNGYNDGIRGKGYVLSSLEAALWSFHKTESFKEGVLAAINLGDDTDTTAAIFGQLAGAYYGIDEIPEDWRNSLYKNDFIETLATALFVIGKKFKTERKKQSAEPGYDNKSNWGEIESSRFSTK